MRACHQRGSRPGTNSGSRPSTSGVGAVSATPADQADVPSALSKAVSARDAIATRFGVLGIVNLTANPNNHGPFLDLGACEALVELACGEPREWIDLDGSGDPAIPSAQDGGAGGGEGGSLRRLSEGIDESQEGFEEPVIEEVGDDFGFEGSDSARSAAAAAGVGGVGASSSAAPPVKEASSDAGAALISAQVKKRELEKSPNFFLLSLPL